jgi:hypothetical protein
VRAALQNAASIAGLLITTEAMVAERPKKESGAAGMPGDRLAGTWHLLGVHRATIYRWLDGSMSVPIVVELLLRLMVRRGIRPAEVTASRHGQTMRHKLGCAQQLARPFTRLPCLRTIRNFPLAHRRANIVL